MNIHFEAAMQYINLENYDKAAEELNKAAEKEMEGGNEKTAMEYRCVLGELLANLDRKEEARDEFAAVVDYCDFAGDLPEQKIIAETFIVAIDTGSALPDFSRPIPRARKRNASAPLVPKPVQNKAFISGKMNRKK